MGVWLLPELNNNSKLCAVFIGHYSHVITYFVLVDDGRLKTLSPEQKIIDKLSERFGHEIEEIFGTRTNCLTANESQYLLGFRSIDEIRNRCVKAKKEIDRRRASKQNSGSYG